MNHIESTLTSQMIEWRHELHRYPELGFAENRTADFVAEKLLSFGVEVVCGIGKTGVLGILKRGRSSKSLGLRADMDALQIQEQNEFDHRSCHQGVMHACGHDGHTSMLLGAASQLAAKGGFDGTVYFIFQPDEEHGKGALSMIDDGLFDRYSMDAVYGLHNLPGLPEGHFAIRPGAIMASESSFEIRLQGKGGHAAMPYTGVDTMLLGAQIVVALQSIVSRNLNVLDEAAVVSVTEFITDGTVNVIPGHVTIKGDCRCFGDEVVEKIKGAMQRIARGLCDAAGASMQFEFNTSFPSTINSPEQTAQAIRAAKQVFGEQQVDDNCKPFTISEDFSNMLRVKPGCYGLIGNSGPADSGCALHNPNYDFNDNILSQGAKYWVQLVHNQLS